MPRSERIDVAGEIYHVISRANGRVTIFNIEKEYQLFESLLLEAVRNSVHMTASTSANFAFCINYR